MPVLHFEQEEGRILEATKRQPLTLTVEESGCLDELSNLLDSYDSGHFDVVHFTGHAWIAEDGPRFITESETGDRVDATAQDIAKALQFRFPALMFLSGCRTGQGGRGGELPAMAEMLLSQGASAVLGWGRPVLDTDGILAAETLYAALASAKTLPQALALTYQAMIGRQARDWHLLRLYVAGRMPQQLVTPLKTRDREKAARPSMASKFLDAENKVKVPKRESFVGRRRPLQACLRALQDPEKVGVLLHGMGGLGKSSLAARLCDRLPDYERVVWVGPLDEPALVNRLVDKVKSSELRQRLQDPDEELKYRLRKLFEAEGGPTFLLVLDDFEANLESVGEGFSLRPAGAAVLGALVWAMEAVGLGHRMLITCRYDFDFTGLARFYRQPLAMMDEADVQKKCAQLEAFREKEAGIETAVQERALSLADGNPRLLEWLNKVLLESADLDLAALLDALANERHKELRVQVLAAELLAQMDAPMKEMLSRALVYELPVPQAAVVEVCEGLADVKKLIGRAVALGLLEKSPDEALRVPRILPLEISESEGLAAQAAQVLYRLWWEEAESPNEAHLLEIHRLAICGKHKDIGKEIGNALTNAWNYTSRYREVINLCNQTLLVVRDHNLLKNLAVAESTVGNLNAAMTLFEAAFNLCPKEDEQLKSSITHEWAIRKAQQGDVDGAILLFQQSLKIKEKIGNAQGIAATLQCWAVVKVQQGDESGALDLYKQSLKISEEISDTQGIAAILHQLAILKAQQGSEAEALDLYKQSLKISEEIGDTQGIAATLHCLAVLEAQQGNVERAIVLHQQSLEIQEKIGNTQGTAVSVRSLGVLKGQQGNLEEALALFQQSLAITEKIGDDLGVY